MYDKTADALDMINQLAQAFGELPGDLKQFIQDQVDEAKAEIEEVFEPVTEKAEMSWWEKRLRETGLFGGNGSPRMTDEMFALVWVLSFGLYLLIYTYWIPLRTQKRLRPG